MWPQEWKATIQDSEVATSRVGEALGDAIDCQDRKVQAWTTTSPHS